REITVRPARPNSLPSPSQTENSPSIRNGPLCSVVTLVAIINDRSKVWRRLSAGAKPNDRMASNLQPIERIFISYGRYSGEIFFDTNKLEDGDRWDREIARRLEHCEALLVVIGPNGLRTWEESGRRRLDNPDDWVRCEVETRLKRGMMGGAEFPKKEYLPEAI